MKRPKLACPSAHSAPSRGGSWHCGPPFTEHTFSTDPSATACELVGQCASDLGFRALSWSPGYAKASSTRPSQVPRSGVKVNSSWGDGHQAASPAVRGLVRRGSELGSSRAMDWSEK